jgi:hypothetical protein
MNATWIVTVFVIIDDVMEHLEHRSHSLARVPDAEILTVAVVAAKYFQNHHERALAVLSQLGYLSGRISTSRFNRRVHALADWLDFSAATLGEVFGEGEVFIIDSMPVPACRRVRAWRCRTLRGRIYCGYCAAGCPLGEGEVLWLALASGLHSCRSSGALQHLACLAP